MKLIPTLIIFLCSLTASSQTPTRKIIDEQTKLPIPFVTIKILHTNKGTIASEKGEFDIEINSTDSILLSCVGYKQIVLIGKNVGNVIYLDTKIKKLEEVIVFTKKKSRTILLGNGVEYLKENINCRDFGYSTSSDCYPWGPSDNKEEFAEKIILPDSNFFYKIKRFYIPVRKINCWGNLLLHVYEYDSLNDCPGEEIFVKLVSINKTNLKRNKVILDVNHENIFIRNSKFFFISVGWLPYASKEKCKTNIMLIRGDHSNTFSRTLTSPTYDWFQFGKIKSQNDEIKQINTIYTVELDEMK